MELCGKHERIVFMRFFRAVDRQICLLALIATRANVYQTEATLSWPAMEMKLNEPPLALLNMIGFDLMTSNEILNSSIFGIHENARGSKSLCDPRLGLPNSEDKCGTCQLVNIEEHQCPGHFGHFSLSLPIFNPEHIHTLVRVLNLVCPNCGKRKVKQSNRKQSSNHHNTSEEFTEGGDCKYCTISAEIRYPELKFKVITKKLPDVEVQTIEMQIVGYRGAEFPTDYWRFLDRSKDIIESPRLVRPLLPVEAIRILKNVPDVVSRKIGLALRPACLIIKDFCIPPNCLRFMDGYKLGYSLRRLERNQKTRSLSSILSISKSLKQAYNDLYSAHKDAVELQARFANYYKSFKIFSGEKEQPVGKRKGFQVKHHKQIAQKAGPSWFKTNILGKRSHFSSLGVISGEPNIKLEELAIPRFVAQKLKVSERITRHNFDKFKHCVHDKFFITRNDERRCTISMQSHSDLQIGDVIERPLKDGDLVFANRLPTIHKHSFLGFQAKIQERCTFGINPIMCGPIAGDFDGDTIHVYVPQSLEARAEVSELLEVSQQMICPQGGQALLRLSEDGILSGYLILQRNFWLNKNEMQMLNMHCNSSVPRPAIVKAPEGRAPLWTGLQLLNMTFPDHIEYDDSNRVLVHESEILQCSVDNKWLNGMVASVCSQAGPRKAVDFLTSLQNVLNDWLLQIGFSVGLKDMLLTNELKSRRKLLTEVQIALEYAKNSSRIAISMEKQIIAKEEFILDKISGAFNHVVLDSDFHKNMLRSTSTKSFEEIAIREFLAVFKDIQLIVERHSSPSNPMLAMIKAGSKGSLSNLVSQCACLGLHLLNGERWFLSKESMDEPFWLYSGIVQSCFLDGLNTEEFISHLISTRKKGKGYGAEGPGELFRNCMFGLREVYLAYDRTVRTRTDNNVVQFCYEGCEDSTKDSKSELRNVPDLSLGTEAVGVLAVTAIIEPAYKYTFDQSSLAKSHPINLLKETLMRGVSTGLKAVDLKSTLTISSQIIRRKSDWARAALKIQDHLQSFTLKMLPLKTIIECNFQRGESDSFFPWIIHIHISQVALRKSNITVENILSIFSQSHKKEKIINSDCSLCEKSEKCIKVRFTLTEYNECEPGYSTDNILVEQLNLIKHSILPLLLKTVIKGSPKIKSAIVQWKELDQWSQQSIENLVQTNPENQPRGELVVEVITVNVPRRGQAWEIVKESCCNVMESIDWKRSRPYSIAEVCFSLGIEAARALIFERLKRCAYELSRKVHYGHLSLISDYMTHTGQVLPFTASGMKEWNKMLDISAPFTEGAFQNPRRTYFDAARRRKNERLSGLLASLVWGKCDTTGESKFFDLIWSSKSQGSCEKDMTSNDQGREILELLSEVTQLELSKKGAKSGATFQDTHTLKQGDAMQMSEESTDMYPDFPPGFESRHYCYTEGNMEGTTKKENVEENISHCGPQSRSCATDTRCEIKDTEILSTLGKISAGGLGPSDTYFHHRLQRSASDAENMQLQEEDSSKETKAGTQGSQNILQLTLSIQNILHHRYHDGEKLSENDMDFLVKEVLVHHPNSKEKIGNGIAAIKIGHNLEHPESRCFIVCHKDGTSVDFSYHKCLRNIPNS